MGLQNVCEMLTEQGLGSGTDSVLLLQALATAHGDPCTLGSKALHTIFLLLQQAFGDQQRHVDILNTLLLELLVHDVLNVLPNGIAIGAVNEDTLDGRIIDQLCLLTYVGKPLGKVYLHIGNLFNFLFFCHIVSSSFDVNSLYIL